MRPFLTYLLPDVPLNWAYQEVQYWWKSYRIQNGIVKSVPLKCLTKLKDNWCTDTIFLMLSIWVFTLIRLKPANVAQMCCITPKLIAKPNGLSPNILFATVMTKIRNHGFIEAEICFIWNKFHTSFIEFAHERSQLGKLVHWVQICIVSNMQIRKYGFKAITSHGSTNEYITRICSLFPEHTPSRNWGVTTQKNNSQKTFEFRASQAKIYILTCSV